MAALSSDAPNSELRTAIDVDGVAGDPTCVLRGEERHNRADIVGLAYPLERLYAENEGLALVGLDEIRHVGVDHARRDCVNADTARPERRREILHQRVDRALRVRVGRQGADGGVGPEGRDENHAAALAEYGKQLLHQEIRRADIDREELIEILDGHFLDGRSFRYPCIGDKDVQTISDDAAGLPGKLAGAVRGGEVHRYAICSATAFAYLFDNAVGFLRAGTVMHENLGTGCGERKCTGAAHCHEKRQSRERFYRRGWA